MKNSLIVKYILGGLATWLIPFVVSFFYYDIGTGGYKPNIIVFKLIMTSVLVVVTLCVFFYIRLVTSVNWLVTSAFFIIINCLLDTIVLLGLFKSSSTMWVLTVLPVYLLIFLGLGYLVLKKNVIDKS
jgi:hypothetical protein